MYAVQNKNKKLEIQKKLHPLTKTPTQLRRSMASPRTGLPPPTSTGATATAAKTVHEDEKQMAMIKRRNGLDPEPATDEKTESRNMKISGTVSANRLKGMPGVGVLGKKISGGSRMDKIRLKGGQSLKTDNPNAAPNVMEMMLKREERERLKAEKAGKQNVLAHQLRLAVHEGGGSIDPAENQKLKQAIKMVLSENMSYRSVQRILQECEIAESRFNTYLLHIRYQRKVFIICTVRTENLLQLKRQVAALLKKYNAAYVYAMHMFNNMGVIEAIVSYQMPVDFSDFETTLCRDAKACNAKGVEIVNYSTGAVNFKCNPIEVLEVSKAIKARGYKVLHIEYGFRAKTLVDIAGIDYENYSEFIQKLQYFADIINVFDNVRHPDTTIFGSSKPRELNKLAK